MNVAFAGTPLFAKTALSALYDAGFDIPLVLTQPDRPAGRGMKLQASPVKAFALEHSIPVYQPVSLKHGEDAHHAIEALRHCHQDGPPEVLVVAAYGLILPQAVLDIALSGCLNIHASVLPRWRGAAPILRAIEAGDDTAGITIMHMDAGLDTGDMCLTHSCAIETNDTTALLQERLSIMGGQAIVKALGLLSQGTLPRRPQPTEGVTYAHKITKEEAWLDWSLPAVSIAQKLRAFDPFPGGLACVVPGFWLKIWAAEVIDTQTMPGPEANCGKIMAISPAGLEVQCGQGRLCITQVQRPGGKRMAVKTYGAGLKLSIGDCFLPREMSDVSCQSMNISISERL